MKLFILQLLLSIQFLSARPIIYLLPHWDYPENFWPKSEDEALLGSWDDYLLWGLWGKLDCRLDEMGYDLISTNMKFFSNLSEKEIGNLFDENNPNHISRIIIHGRISQETLNKIPADKLILYSSWNPAFSLTYRQDMLNRIKDFRYILTWDEDLVKLPKFKQFYYPTLREMKKDIIHISQKKKCYCMILNNKMFADSPEQLYTRRKEIINFYHQSYPSQFDLFGAGWDKFPKVWKGSTSQKLNLLPSYKFCFCLENCGNINGWITERIFECFHCGVVPIYLGAKNIDDHIPENCFIDLRKFKTLEELHSYVQSISEAEYVQYISNIREFLSSEQSQHFRPDAFAEILINALELP